MAHTLRAILTIFHGIIQLIDKLKFDEVLYMKKIIQIACCALGSGMIGFFANQLNTIVGSVCFTLGVAMLVASIVLITKSDKDNK